VRRLEEESHAVPEPRPADRAQGPCKQRRHDRDQARPDEIVAEEEQ